MGVVQKKFSRRHKHKLSTEEKLERDLKDCMKCKYFWGNNNRCINNNPKVVKYVLKTLHLLHPYFFQIKGIA